VEPLCINTKLAEDTHPQSTQGRACCDEIEVTVQRQACDERGSPKRHRRCRHSAAPRAGQRRGVYPSGKHGRGTQTPCQPVSLEHTAPSALWIDAVRRAAAYRRTVSLDGGADVARPGDGRPGAHRSFARSSLRSGGVRDESNVSAVTARKGRAGQLLK
jgi:hypothetical protein